MKSNVRTLNLREAHFWLFRELLDGIPWEAALSNIGTEQNRLLFKGYLSERVTALHPQP